MRRTIGTTFAIGLLPLAFAAEPAGPPDTAPTAATESLDGAWDFRLDPEQAGEKERWFADRSPWSDTVRVPGAWDAQGKGAPAERVFTNFVGGAWYRREAAVPASWTGRRIWLELGGIHRYADVWVNGERAAPRCVGYISPHVIEVTKLVKPGEAALLAVRVDGRQDWAVDALTGCLDIIDAMDVSWGGLWRGARLFATGGARIADAWVATRQEAGGWIAEMRVELAEPAPSGLLVEAGIDDAGRSLVSATAAIAAGERTAAIPMAVPGARPWSPQDPYLYGAVAGIARDGSSGPDDSFGFRFGFRAVEVRGHDLFLNGRPLFLRGFGDDCIFPYTIAPPADADFHRERFRKAREHGFNFVRHHSWWPPEEYLQAADELGFLLHLELPIAYQPFWDRSTEGARKLYVEEWKRAIRRSRSHPSVLAYCVGNEIFGGVPLARVLYRIAKDLDPARLVAESDGAPLPTRAVIDARPPTDIFSVQFDDWGRFGWRDGKYDVGEEVFAPVLVHEMGNFGTFPDVGKIGLYRAGIRPIWLIAARELAEKKGLLGELPEWVKASERLQAVAAKAAIEAARRSPAIDGYSYWLFCDYWTGSNGIVDPFYGDKAWTAGAFRRFNGPTVLLLDRDRVSFRSGAEARFPLLVSRFEDPPSPEAAVRWRLLDGDRVAALGEMVRLAIDDGLHPAGVIAFRFPEVAAPRRLRLDCRLEDRAGPAENSWDFWVFPPARIQDEDDAYLRRSDLIVASRIDEALLENVARGERAIIRGARLGLPSMALRYKPLWWLGDPRADANLGTIWRPSPLLGTFPHDGFGDLHTADLIGGALSYDIDALPRSVVPAVQAVDVPQALRRRGALFEIGVGKGRLIVCGLRTDLETRRADPAAAFLFGELLRAAAADRPAPEAVLSLEEARALLLPKPLLELKPGEIPGVAKPLRHVLAPVEHETHVEGEVRRCWIVRQTDGTATFEWETGPVPAGDGPAVFVWAGGTGWISEPAGGFALFLDGRRILDFDVTLESKTWTSADGKAALSYEVRRLLPNREDSLGIFRLKVAAEILDPLRPARLRIEGLAAGSRRWCILTDQ